MKYKIEVGDIVHVDFNNSQFTLTNEAEVLHVPCATGDSWVFKRNDHEDVVYVSEGCTIVKLADAKASDAFRLDT